MNVVTKQWRVIAASGSFGLILTACGGGTQADASGDALLAQNTVVQTEAQTQTHRPKPAPNERGTALTFSTTGFIDTGNPFFKPFGNGRSCASCHQESQGWTITPDGLEERFTASGGTDPVFRLVDGANSPLVRDTTIDQKRAAYSMLLTRGVIRIGLPIPEGAEFSLAKVDDPYGFASARELSLFRRPLPATNLKFGSTLMWDARETFTDADSNICIAGRVPPRCFAPRDFDLLHQANSAVRGHAQAAQDLSAREQRAILDFEKTLFTAQISDNAAGSLLADGARGGPLELSRNAFYFGINDLFAGDYRTGAPFRNTAMNLYAAWRDGSASRPPDRSVAEARASIVRGEALFNNKQFNVSGVNGLNDTLRQRVFRGTCTSCHDTPNAGTHSVARLFNTGVSAGARRSADMPLYTLKHNTTGEVIETTDPGGALVSGKWKDIGRFKVPSLRAIESRSPYFHDGSIDELSDVMRFYDKRFNIGFTEQEITDLTAFIGAL